MAQASVPTASGVLFELERMVQADDGLLVVSGRWFGVRGRRFVRPTLMVEADGRSHRLLADLKHKPWPAEDGAEWVAAFPWDDGEATITAAEMSVAPDIAIQLAGEAPRDGKDSKAPAGRRGRRAASPGRELAAAWTDLTEERRRGERLSRELSDAQAELGRLRDELESAQAASLEAEAAIARRDAALAKLEEVETQLAKAQAAQKRAVADRDAGQAERDAAVAEREAAVAKRNAALAARERDGAERNATVAERNAAMAERDAARTERDAAVADRDRALADRDRAAADRDAARAAEARAAAAVSSVSRLQPVVPRRHRSLHRPDVGWPTRATALAVLIVVIVAFALITRIL